MKRQFFGDRKKIKQARDLRKGIYILPNFFTTCSLFCAFYSIIASFNGDFTKAAWAILFSAGFDWLDGKIARISNSMSQFGVEYDSLSDLIAFGLAPGPNCGSDFEGISFVSRLGNPLYLSIVSTFVAPDIRAMRT